jgi:hypothetical protein
MKYQQALRTHITFFCYSFLPLHTSIQPLLCENARQYHPHSHLDSLRPVAERSLVLHKGDQSLIALCPVHGKELGVYCEQDKVACCMDCLREHGWHATTTLEEKRAALDKLPSLCDSVSALLSIIEGPIQTLRNRVKLLDKCTEETSKYINEEMDKVRSKAPTVMIANRFKHILLITDDLFVYLVRWKEEER